MLWFDCILWKIEVTLNREENYVTTKIVVIWLHSLKNWGNFEPLKQKDMSKVSCDLIAFFEKLR